MSKTLFKPILNLLATVCAGISRFWIWGFLCAFEPGQAAWRTIYPAIFALSGVTGIVAAIAAAKS
jgi:hypothetical protein